MSTSKHELVDFVEANKTVIGKKPDEHDSKESPGFPSWLKNLHLLYPRMLCAKFGWNWPSGSGEGDENVKSWQTDRWTDEQTDGWTDDGQQVIKKPHFSF